MLSSNETSVKYQYHLEMKNIQGKAVVVVGDASGIGRATALMLAEQGAKVFTAAPSAEDLKKILAEIEQAGGRGEGMVVDMCRPESARRFFEQAGRRLGRIDAVVSCLAAGEGLSARVDPEACQNLFMQTAVIYMQTNGKGHIINVGSPREVDRSSLIPVTGKISTRSLGAALRRQANELGIRVTAIETGSSTSRELGAAERVISADDVARCIYESLIQPFGMDVIFLPGKYQAQPL